MYYTWTNNVLINTPKPIPKPMPTQENKTFNAIFIIIHSLHVIFIIKSIKKRRCEKAHIFFYNLLHNNEENID